MDAVLLILECVGMVLVVRWAATRRGEGGLLGWKPPAAPKPPNRWRR